MSHKYLDVIVLRPSVSAPSSSWSKSKDNDSFTKTHGKLSILYYSLYSYHIYCFLEQNVVLEPLILPDLSHINVGATISNDTPDPTVSLNLFKTLFTLLFSFIDILITLYNSFIQMAEKVLIYRNYVKNS